jgi:hypothetical protein
MPGVTLPAELEERVKAEMVYLLDVRTVPDYIRRAVRQQTNRDKANRERAEAASAQRKAAVR